jgi:hypothetical protein
MEMSRLWLYAEIVNIIHIKTCGISITWCVTALSTCSYYRS